MVAEICRHHDLISKQRLLHQPVSGQPLEAHERLAADAAMERRKKSIQGLDPQAVFPERLLVEMPDRRRIVEQRKLRPRSHQVYRRAAALMKKNLLSETAPRQARGTVTTFL